MYQLDLHIEMLEEGNYHTMVTGTLDSLQLRIVLDTGASHSCIDKEIAQTFFPELSIVAAEGVNAGIGGSDFEVQVADFPNFNLGAFHLPMLTGLAIVDMSHINLAYRQLKRKPVQMILGNDFLIEHKAVIHYGENKLYFE